MAPQKKVSHPVGLEPIFLRKVLKMYKNNPCLWDTAHEHYHNKIAKSAAWYELLRIWRKLDPGATQHDIKTKIFHMRTNYTRQRRKVESNAAHSAVYTPTLWYYKHMSFLSGKKENDSDDSESDSDSNIETLYVQMPRAQKRPASTLIDQESEPETSTGPVDASAAAFGKSVGAQLHHLSKMQRCIAEKLISDVIYHGKLEQLSMNASIRLQEENAKDNIVIPQSEPSWYDTAPDTGSGQESSSSCTYITNTNEEPVKEEDIDETENAVNFIKVESDESESDNSQDLDEQRNSIDIMKEELM